MLFPLAYRIEHSRGLELGGESLHLSIHQHAGSQPGIMQEYKGKGGTHLTGGHQSTMALGSAKILNSSFFIPGTASTPPHHASHAPAQAVLQQNKQCRPPSANFPRLPHPEAWSSALDSAIRLAYDSVPPPTASGVSPSLTPYRPGPRDGDWKRELATQG